MGIGYEGRKVLKVVLDPEVVRLLERQAERKSKAERKPVSRRALASELLSQAIRGLESNKTDPRFSAGVILDPAAIQRLEDRQREILAAIRGESCAGSCSSKAEPATEAPQRSDEELREAIHRAACELGERTSGGLVVIADLRERIGGSALRFDSVLWELAQEQKLKLIKLNDRSKASERGIAGAFLHPATRAERYYVRALCHWKQGDLFGQEAEPATAPATDRELHEAFERMTGATKPKGKAKPKPKGKAKPKPKGKPKPKPKGKAKPKPKGKAKPKPKGVLKPKGKPKPKAEPSRCESVGAMEDAIEHLAKQPAGYDNTAKTIAAAIGCTPRHARRAMKAAESRGLVSADRRDSPVLYDLTNAGRTLAEQLGRIPK